MLLSTHTLSSQTGRKTNLSAPSSIPATDPSFSGCSVDYCFWFLLVTYYKIVLVLVEYLNRWIFCERLWQFLKDFPIGAVGYALDDTVLKKSGNVARSRGLRALEWIHHLLRLELVRQLSIAVIKTSSPAAYHKLLVLVGKVVVGHFAEKELLRLILDFHHYAAESLIYLIHR